MFSRSKCSLNAGCKLEQVSSGLTILSQACTNDLLHDVLSTIRDKLLSTQESLLRTGCTVHLFLLVKNACFCFDRLAVFIMLLLEVTFPRPLLSVAKCDSLRFNVPVFSLEVLRYILDC